MASKEETLKGSRGIERRRIVAAAHARPDLTELPGYLKLTEALHRGGGLGDVQIPPSIERIRELLNLGRDQGCCCVTVAGMTFEWAHG